MTNTDNLLQDFEDIEPLAKQLNRTTRTVRRWMDEPDGLPYARIGNRLIFHKPTTRAWLLRRVKQRNPRRRKASASTASHEVTAA